jgi:hypothetical protein
MMISASEIEQRFSRIEQSIGQAAQTCQSEPATPQPLKQCIDKLDQRSSMARDDITSNDPQRVRQAVDDLEMLGDEAKRVCREQSQVPPALANAVIDVHDQLSNLKHQLH